MRDAGKLEMADEFPHIDTREVRDLGNYDWMLWVFGIAVLALIVGVLYKVSTTPTVPTRNMEQEQLDAIRGINKDLDTIRMQNERNFRLADSILKSH